MRNVADFIKRSGGTVIRPLLEENTTRAAAGSIPDQLYAVIPDEKKQEFQEGLIKEFHAILENIVRDVKKNNGMNSVLINMDEVHQYFNFFFIFHPIVAAYPSYPEFIEAEKKIKIRSLTDCFAQQNEPDVKKWDKCDLCGERKQVHIVNDLAAVLTDKERICSVCMLKRFLFKAVESIAVEPKYQSTSDIAAVPINEQYREMLEKPLGSDRRVEIEGTYDELIEWCKSNTADLSGVTTKERFSEPLGRCLFMVSPPLGKFRESFKKLEKDGGFLPTPWLERPFYAIVYMDGDNMGDAFRGSGEHFRKVSETVSSVLTQFTHEAETIVGKYWGQLIYAGGDDVNFIIHPDYLTICVEELVNKYKELFSESVARIGDTLPKGIKDKLLNLSLSTGAVVCYHKYPLSEAIKRSYQTLTHKAKEVDGKNALAIHLIKGHTETFTVGIPNSLLKSITSLKDKIGKGAISRTTPYRMREEEHLLDQLLRTDTAKFREYLSAVLKGTRNTNHDEGEITAIVKELTEIALVKNNIGEYRVGTMIDVLLYLRFLTGGR